MKIDVKHGNIMDVTSDVAVVNLFEGVTQPGGATGAADAALDGLITDLIDDGEVSGKLGATTLLHRHGTNNGPRRVLVVGLGPTETFDLHAVREASAAAVDRVRKFAETTTTVVHGAGIGSLHPRVAAQAVAEGTALGTYRFEEFKTLDDDEQSRLNSLSVIEFDQSKVDEIRSGVESGLITSRAQNTARDLVNQPANALTPTMMCSIAEDLAESNSLEIKVLGEATCSRMGMGAFCGVAQGSEEPALFVHLIYEGDTESPANNVWLLGKSITFDSGGLSLKSSAGMRRMKGDMGGGAAVLGAMQAITQRKPSINVHAVLPITENMPGGKAQRPGDIVKSMSGTYIEIDNTDAEGRLTLADAVEYARTNGATRIIDIATLTGAARVALGTGNSAMFSNDDSLANCLLSAATTAGEGVWRLPLDPESKRLNRSTVADIKNSGGPSAGSISAAHFIAKFVKDTPWVHLDIAATSMLESSSGVFKTPGATGIPTRTLVELVSRLADDSAARSNDQ